MLKIRVIASAIKKSDDWIWTIDHENRG
jgi:hypothetical protein